MFKRLKLSKRGGTGAAIDVYQEGDDWRVKIRFEDGEEAIADRVFASEAEALEAFNEWCAELGVTPMRSQ